ncbi:hypothetical protein [Streptomyces sp. AV19]|uniref:hypothetical protein n=1 Tax=Streptomyces sp. AV19 TaxID=2793068 RepID=UPI001F24CAC1|nr:hypothetical protein [Streptomyces sp. AV19]
MALSRATLGVAQRAVLAKRLRVLAGRLTGPGAGGGAHDLGTELETASDEEMFELIDNIDDIDNVDNIDTEAGGSDGS